MKTKLLALAAALMISGLATGICYAQPATLVVNIPFAFQVGNQTMPPGEYRVESEMTGSWRVQLLREVDSNGILILSTLPVESKAENPDPLLTFHRYGKTYFLAQIWTGGPEGRELIQSHREKELARGEQGAEISLLLHPVLSETHLSRRAA